MGYRHYFYKVSKSDVEKVKNMTYDELCNLAEESKIDIDEEDGKKWFDFNDAKFLNQVEVFEFGKLYWDDTAERIYSKGIPLFAKDEVQKCFDDYVPYVVGKEGLIVAINIYTEKVLNYYKDLLVDGTVRMLPLGITMRTEDKKSFDKIVEHIQDKIDRISVRGLVNTDENTKSLTSSWEYEHSIFNLAFLLKTIDWEKDTLLFYGW